MATTFLEFPLDILRLIVEELSDIDQASLVLSSKQLLSVLGNKSFDIIKKSPDLKITFLETLSRGLPDFIPCHICAALHSWKPTFRDRECLDLTGSIIVIPGELALHFVDVQLIMRAHQISPDYGISLSDLWLDWRHPCYQGVDQFVSSEVINLGPGKWSGTYRTDFVEQPVECCSELRITKDGLVLRAEASQEVDIARAAGRRRFERDHLHINGYDKYILDVFVTIGCPHSRHFSKHTQKETLRILQKAETHLRRQIITLPLRLRDEPTHPPSIVGGTLYRCPGCPTELNISALVFGDGKCSLVVVFWRDLGLGTDPGTQPWKVQQPLSERNQFDDGIFTRMSSYNPLNRDQLSIREAFESLGEPKSARTHLQVPTITRNRPDGYYI